MKLNISGYNIFSYQLLSMVYVLAYPLSFFLFINALYVFFKNISKGLSLLLTFKKYFCFIDLYLFIYLGWGKE